MSGLFTALPPGYQLVQSQTVTGTPTNIDFTDLGSFKQLLVCATGLFTNTASSDAPALRMSNDNGLTWLSTNYFQGSATTNAFALNSNGAAAQEFAFIAEFFDWNSVTRPAKFRAMGTNIGSGLSNRGGYKAAGGYNGVRIYPGAGTAQFTAGLVSVYGIK